MPIEIVGLSPISGSLAFTTAGPQSFTVPSLVTRLTIIAIGGGAGGAGEDSALGDFGGGGGSGAGMIMIANVLSSQVIDFTIGAGGAGGTGTNVNGTAGGSTIFAGITLGGGQPPPSASIYSQGTGGIVTGTPVFNVTYLATANGSAGEYGTYGPSISPAQSGWLRTSANAGLGYYDSGSQGGNYGGGAGAGAPTTLGGNGGSTTSTTANGGPGGYGAGGAGAPSGYAGGAGGNGGVWIYW